MPKAQLNWFQKLINPIYQQIKKPIEADILLSLDLLPINTIQPDDIIGVGFPKSGNTWFQNLIAGIVYGIDVRFLPQAVIGDLVPGMGQAYYRRYTTPSYFKSHDLPKPEFRRVIYLLRDGRDAMVSYYFYRKALGDKRSWLEMVEKGTAFKRWHEHVQEWLKNPYDAEMMILRYEDLLTKPLSEMQRFCQFAKIERTDTHLEWAIQNAKFDAMQQRETSFGMPGDFPKDKRFVRRGVSGSYKDEMPQEALELFMKLSEETLRRTSYL